MLTPPLTLAPPRRYVAAHAMAAPGGLVGLLEHLRRAVVTALPALGVYAAVRLTGVLLLGAWAAARGVPLVDALAGSTGDPLPLYSLADAATTRWAGSITGPLVLTAVAGLAAAWGMFRFGERLHSVRTGVILAGLWAAIPYGVVESSARPVAAVTALAAWALWALLDGRWLTAALLGAAAGLIQPEGAALALTITLAALVACARGVGGWRPYLAVMLAPAGWLGYLAWISARAGHVDAYGALGVDGIDSGGWTVAMVVREVSRAATVDPYLVTFTLVAGLTLFVVAIFERQWWPALIYSGLLLIGAVVEVGDLWSRPLGLLPAFTLLVPVAATLASVRTHRATIAVALIAIVSGAAGAYLALSPAHPL